MAINFNLSKVFNNLQNVNYDSLYQYFKTHHFHSLYVKNVDTNLVLIHNNSSRYDTNSLHNECRSIIVDVTDTSKPTIITYTHDNVEYNSLETYIPDNNEIVEESYEGTMVSVYNCNDKWYFSSTKCASIDDSLFFNKKKSHGTMLDEILSDMFPNITDVREEFVKYLNKDKCYFFIIIHHENRYLIDYSYRFGDNYKKLLHVITRNKETQEEEDVKLNIPLVYPKKYDNYTEATNDELMKTNFTEGIIIKKRDNISNKLKLIKIPTTKYIKNRFEKPNYVNPLISCIEIYQRNDSSYKPENFISNYYPDVKLTDGVKDLDITGVLHYLFKNLATELSIIYNYFTHFDKANISFVKRNTTVYQNVIMKNDYKIIRNTINRLQNYQIKYLKRSFTFNDFLDHLRNYTSPNDIYNMFKEHNKLTEDKNELYQVIEVNMLNVGRYNGYVKKYIEVI